MYTPPKVVVVDDKLKHLEAIVEHFRLQGAPCLGIQFTGHDALKPEFFAGVRYLFMDLHLLSGGSSSDNKQHYAAIAQILESAIGVNTGPFVLIIWTENAHLKKELTEYLDERIDKEKPHARPLAILTIDKTQVIDTTTGTPKSEDIVHTSITEVLAANPQLLALLEWEKNVIEAGAATLSALLNLVPMSKRNSKDYAGALDEVLSQLAEDALGKAHANRSPGAAISSALTPILADRLIAKTSYRPDSDVWKNAVSSLMKGKRRKVDPSVAGQVNRMLHVAVHDGEKISPGDWGAVVHLPDAWKAEEAFKSIFEMKLEDIYLKEFKIDQESHKDCSPILLHIGAPCDHAQKKMGPATFLLGVQIPLTAKLRKDEGGKEMAPTAACWFSPFLTLGDNTFRVGINFRFMTTTVPASYSAWEAVFRIREQLLMDLINRHSSYTARPGFVQSRPD